MSQSFADRVLELSDPMKPFKPEAYYDADGDCIEFIISGDDFYAERIDELVTVYYSRDSNQIIGTLIKGVTAFLKAVEQKLPGLCVEVKDGPVRLEHLFLAKKWTTGDRVTTIKYEKLIEIAEQHDAKAVLAGAC
jgi:hypothetical protein